MKVTMHKAYFGIATDNHPEAWLEHVKKYNTSVARKVVTTANLLRLADAKCWYAQVDVEDPDARQVTQFLEVKDDAGNLTAIIRRVNGSNGKHRWNNTQGWCYTVFVNFPSHNGEPFGGGNLHLWEHPAGNFCHAFGNYTFHSFTVDH